MLSLKKLFEGILLEINKPEMGWLNLKTGKYLHSYRHFETYSDHMEFPKIPNYDENGKYLPPGREKELQVLKIGQENGWVRLADAGDDRIAVEVFREDQSTITGLQDFSNKYYPRANFYIDIASTHTSYTVLHKDFMDAGGYKDLRSFRAQRPIPPPADYGDL